MLTIIIIIKFWPFIKTRLKLTHLKGSGEKAKEKCEKILIVAGDSIEGSVLDNCDDKAFSIHKLWLLSGGGGVSGWHQKGVLTAHNWWSVEYETAASSTTQQYKEKHLKVLEVEGCHSSVVRALVAKASGPGFESPGTTKIFLHLSCAFFQTPLGKKVSIYLQLCWC